MYWDGDSAPVYVVVAFVLTLNTVRCVLHNTCICGGARAAWFVGGSFGRAPNKIVLHFVRHYWMIG